ncbi:hypothetical protein ACN9M0_35335 [Streptomyces sp. R-07]|uniref:hypothetical protein n=1 Tax=unclassified Streptomyces TaxID=2593676 RepID=UPI003440A0E9
MKDLRASRLDLKYGMGPMPYSRLLESIRLYGTEVVPSAESRTSLALSTANRKRPSACSTPRASLARGPGCPGDVDLRWNPCASPPALPAQLEKRGCVVLR